MKEQKEPKEPKEPAIYALFLLLFCAVIVWLLNYIIFENWFGSLDPALGDTDERGIYGDQFGAVNALFSGMAFSGLLYAIWVQRFEVRLAKLDAANTKRILDDQTKLIAAQLQAQAKRDFESTFFHLVNTFNALVRDMDIRKGSNAALLYQGKDCFKFFWKEMRGSEIESARRVSTMYPSLAPRPEIDNEHLNLYRLMYTEQCSSLGYYFRSLYNLLCFIDESPLGDTSIYSKLVRAQLSEDESTILFYNGLSPLGEKMKPLIEKYKLLKNVPYEVVSANHLFQRYDVEAFGPNPTYFEISRDANNVFLKPKTQSTVAQ